MVKWRYTSMCLSLGARFKWVLSFMLWPLQPRDLLDRKLDGPGFITVLDLAVKTKFPSLKWIKGGRPAHPTAIHYTDGAIPANIFSFGNLFFSFLFLWSWKTLGNFPAYVFLNLKAHYKGWNLAKSCSSVLIPTLICSWNKNEDLVVSAERKLKISDLEFINKRRIWRALNCGTWCMLLLKSLSVHFQSQWPRHVCCSTEQMDLALHVDCWNLLTV
jgi:hypothetical protein